MNKSKITKPELLVGGVILLALTSVATPQLFGKQDDARRARTITNAKQIGNALAEFDERYGEFPSRKTKIKLLDEGKKLPEGYTANAYFSQFLASKILNSKTVFYVDGLKNNKPSKTKGSALGRGENGFGYVMKVNGMAFGMHNAMSMTPIVVAPLSKGGELPKFEHQVYDGVGIVLHADSSVGAYQINQQGELLSKKTGRNLFAPGNKSLWDGITPEVKEPWLLEEKTIHGK